MLDETLRDAWAMLGRCSGFHQANVINIPGLVMYNCTEINDFTVYMYAICIDDERIDDECIGEPSSLPAQAGQAKDSASIWVHMIPV